MKEADFYNYLADLLQIKVSETTTFFDEIGLSGYDADLFMQKIQAKFNIDLEEFNSQHYYVQDGDNIFKLLYNHYSGKKKMPNKKFTAKHLYQVVIRGSWFERAGSTS